ncbi:4'-phosphopantetheinyl transferase [Crucibulum laeve]|uniref:4'-phosphopantetheinyl transferase n=1 Tax=Crucibulum laeve TaxID=68775 RepID=A0A5C3MFA3_9AGAR|nr:4'-phosphopantetheinyl transferase [Crucibulum laeve]
MPILGIGIDLVHIPRISAILFRNKAERFATRILSEREFSEWQNLSDEDSVRAKFLAVRWSVKEAAYKAIYPVARPTWKEFTYCGLHTTCKPSLMYHPLSGKDNTRTINKIHVSVSHDGEYVYTSVIVEES